MDQILHKSLTLKRLEAGHRILMSGTDYSALCREIGHQTHKLIVKSLYGITDRYSVKMKRAHLPEEGK